MPGWLAAAAPPTSDVQLAIVGLQAMQLANLRHGGRLLHDCQQVGPGCHAQLLPHTLLPLHRISKGQLR